jgi:hypothetical protein
LAHTVIGLYRGRIEGTEDWMGQASMPRLDGAGLDRTGSVGIVMYWEWTGFDGTGLDGMGLEG